MSKRIPMVAIIGRTNVGKSTLFNALVGRPASIVEDSPGVTRDRHYALIKKFPVPFTLIDTGGMLHEDISELSESIRTQTEIAVQEADLIIAVFDGLHGVHPHDSEVTDYLRQTEKPIVWVINKCEKPSVELRAGEFFELGIAHPMCISAAHRKGVRGLLERVREELQLDDPVRFISQEEDEKIRVAVLGRPNVGKSTFINTILGEQRLVTSSIAGTTRDSIDTPVKREGRELVLVDTAGLRKRKKVEPDSIEHQSNEHTVRSLASCDVAVLLLDATQGIPAEQDAKVAGLIHERGRSLVIVVNKWDAIEKDHRSAKQYEDGIHEVFKFVRYAPVLFVSALTGKRCPQVIRKIIEVYDAARQRIQTAELNKLLAETFERHPPAVHRGDPVKLLFATQIGVAPPTFVLFVNHPDKINFSYQRYINNSIRSSYPYEGTRIKLIVRKRTQAGEEKRLSQTF